MNIRNGITRLLVSDFNACFVFYKDIMGFPIVTHDEKGGYAEFKVGDMRFALFKRQDMAEIVGNTAKPPQAECQDQSALIFNVSDVEEAYQELRHKGVQFTITPMNNPNYSIKTAYLRDPDGMLIGLYQMLN